MQERERLAAHDAQLDNLCDRLSEVKVMLTEHIRADAETASELTSNLSDIKLALAANKSAGDTWFRVAATVAAVVLGVMQAVIIAHVTGK